MISFNVADYHVFLLDIVITHVFLPASALKPKIAGVGPFLLDETTVTNPLLISLTVECVWVGFGFRQEMLLYSDQVHGTL